jgi:hypothetical protein
MERYIEGPLLGGSGSGGSPPPPATRRSASGPEPIPPHVRELADRLSPGGKRRTTTIFAFGDDEGEAVEFNSRRDPTAADGLKSPYKDLLIMDHAEAPLVSAIRPSAGGARRVTAVINNEPCPGLRGCDAVFADLIPTGTAVTMYVKPPAGTRMHSVYQGTGKGIA